MTFIDISVPLHPEMPSWPGSPGVVRTSLLSMDEGDVANASALAMDVHAGTHVDAPLHFVSGGEPTDAIPIDVLVGPALVVELPDQDRVTSESLRAAAIPETCSRLLLKTANSRDAWFGPGVPFREDYVALSESAAQWLVESRIDLIGIDYLSIQKFDDGPEVHQILLGSGVVIVEGLHLTHVQPGSYDLICLPIRTPDCEGAPARAVLRLR